MGLRAITGLIGAVLVLAIVFVGREWFTLLIALLASVAMFEIMRMKRIPLVSFRGLISMGFMWILLVPTEWLDYPFLQHITKTEIFLTMILGLLALTVVTKNSFTFDEAGFVILSSVYIGYGFHSLIMIRQLPDIGLAVVILILFLIWATDSGAYFIGKNFGRHRPWPEISPKKTIEGFVGGLVAAFVVGFIFEAVYPVFHSYLIMSAFIVVTSIFGQLGDLVESALKRHYAVKDSGNILPGHGGILDRFDSLIFVMPLLHFFYFFG
ncbi:phosphatidate cytidylyltransferase [Marinococcus halophilus]|uniref:Phosphatidate cytidylyltransferase n=1 Tax=Marinococcus halophilus TaxID=1371 RepID=A0A510Y2A9_MARHA|nr:phosphatidate cytidylyltransferase [Marinococcus halophilus]OZT81465.1 phosphatidate cytidylyltransferase [Marinococcus halophilus]GEK57424.1 phosphatidate cytidylyltransferase [Marinococcus halophilus]